MYILLYFAAMKSCGDDTGCTPNEMCIGGACADPCKVTPDVCADAKIENGVCAVRNHRPLCSCPTGQSLDSEKKKCVDSPTSSNSKLH